MYDIFFGATSQNKDTLWVGFLFASARACPAKTEVADFVRLRLQSFKE
jgi:hypothetical protein